MLSFVVCGIEHSGTTLISDLFRQVPGLDAGFEVGVLLSDSPRAFRDSQPFADNILEGWGISSEALDRCCDTDDFEEFYRRLKECSGVLKSGTHSVFDKTPRYFSVLGEVLRRSTVPFVVSHKDPASIVFSDFTRAKSNDFLEWYKSYRPTKIRYMRKMYGQQTNLAHNSRVMFVALENLCLDTRRVCDAMFAHVGLEFDLDYLLLSKLRYKNTKTNAVSARTAFAYREHFSVRVQDLIRGDFSEFSSWFYK